MKFLTMMIITGGLYVYLLPPVTTPAPTLVVKKHRGCNQPCPKRKSEENDCLKFVF